VFAKRKYSIYEEKVSTDLVNIYSPKKETQFKKTIKRYGIAVSMKLVNIALYVTDTHVLLYIEVSVSQKIMHNTKKCNKADVSKKNKVIHFLNM
jgi:hypothetical protein